jgi:hypothetical protein
MILGGRCGRGQPADRGMQHTEGPSDVGQCLAGVTAGNCFTPPVRRQLAPPVAFARARPSLVRDLMSSRSNSAKPPWTVSMSLPCGVVVSAHFCTQARVQRPPESPCEGEPTAAQASGQWLRLAAAQSSNAGHIRTFPRWTAARCRARHGRRLVFVRTGGRAGRRPFRLKRRPEIQCVPRRQGRPQDARPRQLMEGKRRGRAGRRRSGGKATTRMAMPTAAVCSAFGKICVLTAALAKGSICEPKSPAFS